MFSLWLLVICLCIVSSVSQFTQVNQDTSYNDRFGFGNSGFSANSPLGSISSGSTFGGGYRDFDQSNRISSGPGFGGFGFPGGIGSQGGYPHGGQVGPVGPYGRGGYGSGGYGSGGYGSGGYGSGGYGGGYGGRRYLRMPRFAPSTEQIPIALESSPSSD